MGRTRTAWRRSSTQATAAARLSRNQIITVIAALAVGIAGIAVAAALVSPNRARTFDLIHGSLFLADNRAPVAIDLATGKPTVRLVGANSQVGAGSDQLSVVPLSEGTLLLNNKTGEFNMVDGTGFVIKTTAGGVPLPRQVGDTSAVAVPSGNSAYVVRLGSTNTSVFLVNAGTVQAAAIRTGARVVPRASAVLPDSSLDAPGVAASGNGDLWVLTGTTNARTLRRLTLPASSQTGATLAATAKATLSGLAALESVPGPTSDTVTLATPTQLQEFAGPSATKHTLAVTGLSGVDQILPASNNSAGSAFLFHTAKGWSLVTAPADSATAEVHLVKGIPAKTQLTEPALSNGKLYTMDRGTTGTIWQLGLNGQVASVPGVAAYPVQRSATGQKLESGDFGRSEVVADRSRVLFNDPDHVLALAVFTDNSHPATVIDKSSATDLNAAGGANAITTQHNDALRKANPDKGKQPQQAPQPKTPSAPAINNKITCKTTTQVPHVPTITTATSASRSVLLNWNYPLLDSEDCVPSTYQITVKTLTNGSPAAPGQANVQGQTQVNLTGLYPSTRYQITVAAYLNGRGTASPSVVVTTGPEGPAAPTGVTAAADQSGDWTINWKACGSVAKGCVPAATWSVIPRFCDGLGLSNPPAALPVVGDQTLTTFSTELAGGTALLGRGLSFAVQGVSDAGNVGTTSASTDCVYTWAPPDPSAMHLTASQPGNTALGATTSTTVTLDLGKNPTAAVGGVGGQITFQLLNGSSVVQSKGPGTANTAVFAGISAGNSYTARAIVTPPRHPAAAVTLGPVTITTRSDWPSLSITAAKVVASSSDPRSGTLSVTIGGLSSAAAGGERFDLTDSSVFSCGNTSQQLTTNGAFDPSTKTIGASINLLQYYGDCHVNVQLKEDDGSLSNLPVFGGTESPTVSANVQMPGLPTGGGSASDFSAAWDSQPTNNRSTITVKTTGNDPSLLFVVAWTESVNNTVHDDCAADNEAPPATMPVKEQCVADKGGTPGAWSVRIDYQLLGQAQPQTVYVKVTGNPPTYQPPSSNPPTSPPTTPPPSTSPPAK